MSHMYQKADPSYFSDLSSSPGYMTYANSQFQHPQYTKSIDHLSSPSPHDQNNQPLTFEDESLNDISFEEPDAVKRFCNFNSARHCNGNTKQNVVNNEDKTVNTSSNDALIETEKSCVLSNDNYAHNENTESNEAVDDGSTTNNSNTVTDCDHNVNNTEINDSGSHISSNQSQENDNARTPDHNGTDNTQTNHSLDTLPPLITDSNGCTSLANKQDDSPDGAKCSYLKEDPSSESDSSSRSRSTRLRAPSLKLIEAVGCTISAKHYDKVLSKKVTPKKEPPSPDKRIPSLVAVTDVPNVTLSPVTPGSDTKKTTTEFQSTPTIKDSDTSPWPVLGEGWVKKEVMRRNGASAGRYDIYYISPEGIKVRSKPELQGIIGSSLDLTNFNFRLGEFLLSHNGRPNSKRKKKSIGLTELPLLIVAEEHSTVSMVTPPNPVTLSPARVTLSPARVTSSPTLMTSFDEKEDEYKEKLVRCKKCANCVRENCGRCVHCRDMRQFGGTNSRRQSCLLRKCAQPSLLDKAEGSQKPAHPNPKFVYTFKPRDTDKPSKPPKTTHRPPATTLKTSTKHLKRADHKPGKLSQNSPQSLITHPRGIRVKIAVKGKRLRESPQSSSNKRQKMFQTGESRQIVTADSRPAEGRQGQIPCSALQKYIDLSRVPQEYKLPVNHVMTPQIGGKNRSCPLLWIDDLFHQQTVLHYGRNVRIAGEIPPPPVWPSLLMNFYNFTFQFTVTLNDVQYQFSVVEKVKVQTSKVCQYVVIHGSHVRDITVDLHFYQFLESIELYQYLPNHSENTTNVPNSETYQQKAMDDEMKIICGELTNLINDNCDIEDGLRKLLLKYLTNADLCTFILAVVNSNTVPTTFEAAVVEILRRDLNLTDIANLTDLTGVSLSEQPEVAAVETVSANSDVANSVEKPDINKTLSSLVPDNSAISEDVRNFILNEPLKVIEMINVLQQNPSGKALTFETLSQMILDQDRGSPDNVVHIKTEHDERPTHVPALGKPPLNTNPPVIPGKGHCVQSSSGPYPATKAGPYNDVQFVGYVNRSTPPGYNPRYYTPHLSPQHQQRYGRPPLRRAAPSLGAIKHIAAPVIPGPRTGPRVMREVRKMVPPTVLVNKGVQVKPSQRTVQQQVSLKPLPRSQSKPDKFVDLNFCPHV